MAKTKKVIKKKLPGYQFGGGVLNSTMAGKTALGALGIGGGLYKDKGNVSAAQTVSGAGTGAAIGGAAGVLGGALITPAAGIAGAGAAGATAMGSGALLGSALPGVGTVLGAGIGGMISLAKAQDESHRMKRRDDAAEAYNQFADSSNRFSEFNPVTNTQTFRKGGVKMYSRGGKIPNAMLDNKEVIKDPQTGKIDKVFGPSKTDSIPANLKEGTKILSDDLNMIGNYSYADAGTRIKKVQDLSSKVLADKKSSKLDKDTALLNKMNADKAFDKLLKIQESKKLDDSMKKAGIKNGTLGFLEKLDNDMKSNTSGFADGGVVRYVDDPNDKDLIAYNDSLANYQKSQQYKNDLSSMNQQDFYFKYNKEFIPKGANVIDTGIDYTDTSTGQPARQYLPQYAEPQGIVKLRPQDSKIGTGQGSFRYNPTTQQIQVKNTAGKPVGKPVDYLDYFGNTDVSKQFFNTIKDSTAFKTGDINFADGGTKGDDKINPEADLAIQEMLAKGRLATTGERVINVPDDSGASIKFVGEPSLPKAVTWPVEARSARVEDNIASSGNNGVGAQINTPMSANIAMSDTLPLPNALTMSNLQGYDNTPYVNPANNNSKTININDTADLSGQTVIGSDIWRGNLRRPDDVVQQSNLTFGMPRTDSSGRFQTQLPAWYHLATGLLESPEQMNPSQYMTGKIRPYRYNERPELRASREASVISRANAGRINTNTGANLNYGIAAQGAANRANQDIYAKKYHADAESQMKADQMNAQIDQANNAMKLKIESINAANRAKKDDFVDQAMKEFGQEAQAERLRRSGERKDRVAAIGAMAQLRANTTDKQFEQFLKLYNQEGVGSDIPENFLGYGNKKPVRNAKGGIYKGRIAKKK